MVLSPNRIPVGHSTLTQSVILREEYALAMAPNSNAIQCSAAIDRVLNQIYVDIQYQAVLMCECARCLESFKLPVAGLCRAVLEEKSSDPDQIDEGLESEVDFFYDAETEEVDIQSVLYDELVTSVPMKPLCREDCSGLLSAVAAVEGKEVSGSQPEKGVDPRWAALQKLKKA